MRLFRYLGIQAVEKEVSVLSVSDATWKNPYSALESNSETISKFLFPSWVELSRVRVYYPELDLSGALVSNGAQNDCQTLPDP